MQLNAQLLAPIQLVALSVALLLLFFGVGAGLLRMFRLPAEGYFGLFLQLVLGLGTVVGCYAVLITHGNSLCWLVLLVLFMVVRNIKQSSVIAVLTSAQPKETLINLLLVTVAGIFFTVIRLPLLYDFHSGQLGVPYYDFVYYAKLTYPLNELGVETAIFDPVNHGALAPLPYHYIENWLNALAVRVTGMWSVHTLFISVYSTLIAMAYVGYCAIYQHFGNSQRWSLALALVSLPVTGLFLPVFARVALLKGLYFDLSNFFFLFPKLTVLLVFTLLAFLLFLKAQRTAALWALTLLPIAFISTAPALCLGTGAWAVYQTLRGRSSLLTCWLLLRPLFLVVVSVGLFYFINFRLHQSEQLTMVKSSERFFNPLSQWRYAPNFIIGLFVALGAYFALYFVLVSSLLFTAKESVLTFARRHESLFVLAGFIFASAGLCWFIFFPYYESWQLFNNTILPVCSVAVVILVAAALADRRLSVRLAVLMLLTGLLGTNYYQLFKRVDSKETSHQYEADFLRQIARQEPQLSPVGAFVLAKTEYAEPFSYNSRVFMPGLYMNGVRNNLVMLSLSEVCVNPDSVAMRYPVQAPSLRRWIDQDPVRNFYQQQLVRNPRLTRAEAQRQFVERYRINFVCVSAAAKLPASLQPLVQSRTVDTRTGEQFYRLKL